MNTRRKVAQQKPEVYSTKWHLLHESYYPIFAEPTRNSVEDWYNLEASGTQREQFRALCSRIYLTAPVAAGATATMTTTTTTTAAVEGAGRGGRRGGPSAVPTQTELVLREEEARTMLLHYGEVLSAEGKAKARGWLLLPETTKREKTLFRELLLGCQPHKPAKGVLKTDHIAPASLDEDVYDKVDRTHFQRSVDWNNLKAREEMQQVQQQRGAQDVQSAHVAILGSGINPTTTAARDGEERKRVTKPKSQFDKVNYLSSLGYDGVSQEEALADIQRRRAEGNISGGGAGTYEVKEDGSTVYIAGGARRQEAVKSENMTAVGAEPMAEWKVKTLQ